MLPAHRVIGHKEYGNTPPGGWKGRKGDPVYDMAWRRDRVANFTPRSIDLEDFMSALPADQQVELARRINYLYDAQVTGGPDAFPGKGMVRWLVEDLPGIIATAVWYGASVNRPTPEDPKNRVLVIQELADAKTAAMQVAGRPVADVDEGELAAALIAPLAAQLAAHIGNLSDEDVTRLAEAVADEADRRARERLSTTA